LSEIKAISDSANTSEETIKQMANCCPEDFYRLQNEFNRQEEAMMNFLNQKIQQSSENHQYKEIYNEFIQNQIKLR